MAALLSETHGGTSSKTQSFLNTKAGASFPFAAFFFVAIFSLLELDNVKIHEDRRAINLAVDGLRREKN